MPDEEDIDLWSEGPADEDWIKALSPSPIKLSTAEEQAEIEERKRSLSESVERAEARED